MWLPCFCRVTIARNLLINSHHYKRHRKNIPTAFHLLSRFTLTTTQLNPVFLKTLNYSKTIQRLRYYLFATSTHFIQTRQKHFFWSEVHSKLMTNPALLKCVRARFKTCPFIHNAKKISGPKWSIKITDHFTCTSANVIYCITCTYCKKIYIGETGRRLGDRFREHLHLKLTSV